MAEPTRSFEDDLEDDQHIQAGKDYGKYRVIRRLGGGGFGEVFLAQDMLLGRQVALKSLKQRWLNLPAGRQQVLTEARAVSRLSHPRIASLYDVLDEEKHCLLVMEYAEGRTAADLLTDGRISLGHAVRLTIQICDALMYAHDHGILHCDLKPSNIQISTDGFVKILDFGLARAKYDRYRLHRSPLVSKESVAGTPSYMAPETFSSGTLSVTTDIYSLGVTLFEMATGQKPFDAPKLNDLIGMVREVDAPKVSSLISGSPPLLDDLVTRALAKNPRHRYQTVQEFSTDLKEVLELLEPKPLPARRFSVLRFALISIVSLTLIGFLASTFYRSPLGLTMEFGQESVAAWPVWGLRSLILPLAQVALLLLVVGVGIQWLGIALAAIPRLRRWYSEKSSDGGSMLSRLQSISPATLASILSLAQVVVLLLSCWRFETLIGALTNFVSQSGSLEALSPAWAEEHLWYVRLFSLLLFTFGWFWLKVWRRQSRDRIPGSTVAAATVMLAFTGFLMLVPYRVLFHNESEQVSYESESCFLVGQKGDVGILFCPQSVLRNKTVDLRSPGLKRTGNFASVFLTNDEKQLK